MPTFFESAAEFGAWLSRHAATEPELVVGFHKRGSGLPSMSWPESVDEALCVGWIDGVRTNIDAHSYKIRFTRRKSASTWSARNIERVHVLQGQGRMSPAGLEAFSRRREEKSKTYAYEQAETATLEAQDEARFRKSRVAWKFFEAQPPSYRHLVVWRIISAKRAGTREARLAELIEASRNGVRL
jgi:uncharacterized protein YdeI (YjbR/CyaY-like superfamily)